MISLIIIQQTPENNANLIFRNITMWLGPKVFFFLITKIIEAITAAATVSVA